MDAVAMRAEHECSAGKHNSCLQRLITGKRRPAKVLRLSGGSALTYERSKSRRYPSSYRDSVCALCERTVSLALDIPLAQMQAKTRCTKDIALARQIAMYLAHTFFSVGMTEVGLHFRRDRSTVSHACAVVEKRRDEVTFDLTVCQLEAVLHNAKEAIEQILEDIDFGPDQVGKGMSR